MKIMKMSIKNVKSKKVSDIGTVEIDIDRLNSISLSPNSIANYALGEILDAVKDLTNSKTQVDSIKKRILETAYLCDKMGNQYAINSGKHIVDGCLTNNAEDTHKNVLEIAKYYGVKASPGSRIISK